MKKRLVSLSLLIGTGLMSLPAFANPDASTVAHRPVPLSVTEASAIAQTPDNETISIPTDTRNTISPTTTSEIKVEERFVLSYDTPSQEYVFTGNANEIAVVYFEEKDGREYWADTQLYAPSGQLVNRAARYPDGLNFAESEGLHRTFQLPETGEYRFTLAADTYIDEYTSSDEQDPRSLVYALKIRVASYEERLIIHGADLMNEERYQAAILVFNQAIAYNPNIPISYFNRAIAYAGLAMEANNIAESSINGLDDLYMLFQAIEPENQALVASDVRQLGQRLIDAIARNEVTAEQVEIDPQVFVELASFFETGERSETLTELIEE
ncbi:MAG: hypothetical protein AAFQ95_24220 [Cyanobacteria bacterium J06621_3]